MCIVRKKPVFSEKYAKPYTNRNKQEVLHDEEICELLMNSNYNWKKGCYFAHSKMQYMDLLTELAYILSHYLPRNFESALPKGSKMRQLFDLVATTPDTNDEKAASIIYQSPASDKRYLMLKRNLINKLIDLVLEVESGRKDNYAEERFACLQKLLISEKLLQHNVYHNAERIIGKVQQIAEQYHLIDVQVQCALQFRTINALKGFPVETGTYHQASNILSLYLAYEMEAQGRWQQLQSKVKFFISYNPDIIEEADAYIATTAERLDEFDSPFMRLYLCRMRAIRYRKSYDLLQWGEAVKELVSLVQAHKFLRTDAIMLESYLEHARFLYASADLAKAEKKIKKSMQYASYSAFNLFEIMALAFDVKMKLQQYDEAGKIWQEVTKVPQFEALDPIDVSSWIIRGIFLRFVWTCRQESKKIAFYLPAIEARSKVLDFLQAKQPVSKDKRGYNMHLVILRLFMQAEANLNNGNLDDISSEGNKMMVYFQRHLKPIAHLRTGEFFKSLSKIASAAFEKAYIAKRQVKLQQRLATDWHIIPYDECEVVAYEKLWEMVVERYARE
jgi:hypothetical protein